MTEASETARNMRDRAVALANQGFSVFPLKAGTKNKPLVPWGMPEGENYFDHIPTNNEKAVYAYWTDRQGEPRDCNIGICTNDLLVIDIDKKNGKNGEKAFHQFVAETGLPVKTLQTITPTGGRHLFYHLPNATRIRNTVGLLGEGVDTRGWHGYVVAPGSVVPAGEYRWLGGQPDYPVATAPEVLLQRLRASKPDQQKATVVEGLELDTPAAVERAKLWLQEGAPESESGQQSHVTFVVACQVKDFGISEEKCEELMLEHWNDEKSFPPLVAEDLAYRVGNAYAYGRDPIGVRAPEGQFDVVELVETVEKVGTTDQPTKKRQPLFWEGFDTARQRMANDGTSWLIKKYLGRSEMSVLYGDSNVGKTFIALDLSYHIATQREWNGRKVSGGLVVYIAAEAGKGIRARLEALHRRYQPAQEPPLVAVPCLVDLFTPTADLRPLLALLAEIAKAYGTPIVMVVVDTLARAIGPGDENSARDMGVLVGALDRIRVATEAHVMIVHHSGKNKANGARGSSALRAATDTELEVEGGRLIMRKQRNAEEAKPVGFRLTSVELGKDEDGDSVTSCTIEIGAAVDFEPQLTNEQRGWVDELREITVALGLETFTRKHMKLAWPEVSETTIRNRGDALVEAKELSRVEGDQTSYFLRCS